MKFEDIPTPAVYRLSFYLRQLEALQKTEKHTISSKQLGDALGYTDAQVRKDLAYFGQFGHPGIGYRVEELDRATPKNPRHRQSSGMCCSSVPATSAAR